MNSANSINSIDSRLYYPYRGRQGIRVSAGFFKEPSQYNPHTPRSSSAPGSCIAIASSLVHACREHAVCPFFSFFVFPFFEVEVWILILSKINMDVMLAEPADGFLLNEEGPTTTGMQTKRRGGG